MEEVISPARGQPISDHQAMQLALREAQKGWGYVSPNPAVGCTILDSQNRFLSTGYHKKFGGPHAEIEALSGVQESDLVGARIFVTLEPCAHQGKTPPCAKRLATLPIQEVVYGLVDPNPLVSGKGLQILQDAGIKTTPFSNLQDELEEICEHFLTNQRQKKIFVSLKIASSLDGQMALKTGESRWITSEASRQQGHFFRANHDATVLGKKTILNDNPKLTIRHPAYKDLKKKIVVMDSNGELLSKGDMQFFQLHARENIFFVMGQAHAAKKLDSLGCKLVFVKKSQNGLDLHETHQKLWDLGLRSLYVEGGSQLISSYISEMAFDRLYLFQAPILLGAKSGRSWTEQVSIEFLHQRKLLKKVGLQKLGEDWLITGRFL